MLVDHIGCVLHMTGGSDGGIQILANHADKACDDWEPKRKWRTVLSKSKKPNDVNQRRDSFKQFLQYLSDKNSRCLILAAIRRLCDALEGKPPGDDIANVKLVINFLKAEKRNSTDQENSEFAVLILCKEFLEELTRELPGHPASTGE